MLIRKPRSYAEVYNDLDGEIVNLFRVLRDPAFSEQLIRQLALTPFARDEFVAAYEDCDEPVERARRLVVLSFQGFGSNAHAKRSTGFRSNSNRSGTTPAFDWSHYPEALRVTVERLRGVIVENKPAMEVMAQHDGAMTTHYVDPPYVWSTRARSDAQRNYRHELTDSDHVELLAFLRTLKGAVALSGYPHPMYDALLRDWRRIERAAHADGALDRVEVLWLNPVAATTLACPPLL